MRSVALLPRFVLFTLSMWIAAFLLPIVDVTQAQTQSTTPAPESTTTSSPAAQPARASPPAPTTEQPAPADQPASAAQPAPAAQPVSAAPAPAAPTPPATTAGTAAAAPAQPASAGTPAVVVDGDMADTILGKSVQSANGDDMGRIVDVMVDHAGQVRAAIIDFGGFLGVGTREIAVDWRVLNFPKGGGLNKIVATLTQDQLRVAPIYKPGETVVIVGSSDTTPPATAPATATPTTAAPAAAAPAVVAPTTAAPTAVAPAAPAPVPDVSQPAAPVSTAPTLAPPTPASNAPVSTTPAVPAPAPQVPVPQAPVQPTPAPVVPSPPAGNSAPAQTP